LASGRLYRDAIKKIKLQRRQPRRPELTRLVSSEAVTVVVAMRAVVTERDRLLIGFFKRMQYICAPNLESDRMNKHAADDQ